MFMNLIKFMIQLQVRTIVKTYIFYLSSNNFFVWVNINTIFYNPNSFQDLKNKVSKKTKLIFVENPGSNTFEFQDLGKITAFAKRRNIYTAINFGAAVQAWG